MSERHDTPPSTTGELSLDEILDRYESRAGSTSAYRNPFKFLDAYGPEDADIFFGREAEAEEALRHFYRKKHLLLYGESGSGKTSLIQCGLRGKIADEDAVFITLRSHADAWRQLREVIHQRVPQVDADADTVELLRALADHESRTVVLVFDQFEELFISHGKASKRRFASELKNLIDVRLDIKLLFVIRQEYLALLTELEQQVPALFDNRLWLRRMSDEDAERAVESACQVCGVGLERGLAANIIRRLTLEGSGVELPYLQVVMDRLYRKAVDRGGDPPFISTAAYESEGRIEDILARFLEEEVDRLDRPAQGRQVLKAMVTGDGTKKVVSVAELSRETLNFGDAIPVATVNGMVRQLIQSRILREDPQRQTLELRHDTLAATVFAWMSGLEKELLEIRQALHNRHREYLSRNRAGEALLDPGFLQYLQPYLPRLGLEPELADYLDRSRGAAQQSQRRKKRVLFAGFAVSFAILLAFSGWNLAERAKVALLAKGLMLGKLESASEELMDTRPVTSVLLGLHILRMADKDRISLRGHAEDRLRSVVEASRSNGIGTLPAAAARLAISADGGHIAALGSSGEVLQWNLDDRGAPLGGPLSVEIPGGATRMALSADGRWLGLAGVDHTVWLQGTNGLAPPRRLGEHATAVQALAFSLDDAWLATAGGDKTIRLWPTDPANSASPRALIGANSLVTELRISADGRWLVCAGLDGSLRIWRWENALAGAEADVRLLLPGPIRQLSVGSDGQWVAAVQRDGGLVAWRRSTGQGQTIDYRPSVSARNIQQAAIDETQQWMATLDRDGAVQLRPLSVATHDSPPTLVQDREANIERIQFAGTDGWLLATGRDRNLRGWRIDEAGTVLESFVRPGHGAPITSLAANEHAIATADAAGEVRRWALRGKPRLVLSDADGSAVTALAFHPAKPLLYVGKRDGGLRQLALSEAVSTRAFASHGSEIAGLDFLDQGSTLVSSGLDGSVRIWTPQRPMDYPPDPLRAPVDLGPARLATFSPDGRWLAALDDLGRPRLWNQPPGEQTWARRSTDADDQQFGRLTFSPDSRRLALYGWDQRIQVLNLSDIDGPNGLRELRADASLIEQVRFDPLGQWLLSRDIHTRSRLWDLRAPPSAPAPLALEPGVDAWAFSPQGDRLLGAAADRRPRWLTLTKGLESSAPKGLPEEFPTGLKALAFSPDGQHLAGLDSDGDVLLWTRQPSPGRALTLTRLPAADSLYFSDSGRWLTVGADDGHSAVGLWALAQRTSVDAPPVSILQAPTGWLRLSANGRWLVHLAVTGETDVIDTKNPAERHPLPTACVPIMAAGFSDRHLATLDSRGEIAIWDFENGQPWQIAPQLPGGEFGQLTATDADTRLLFTTAERLRSATLDNGRPGCLQTSASVALSPAAPALLLSRDAEGFVLLQTDGQGQRYSVDPSGTLNAQARFNLAVSGSASERRPNRLSGALAGLVGSSTRPDGDVGLAGRSRPGLGAAVLNAAAWSAAGQRVATLTETGRVQVRDSDDLRILREVELREDRVAVSVALSDGGRWLAIGFSAGALWLMDLDQPDDAIRQLQGHDRAVRQLRFSPDEHQLASGSDDGSVRLWRTDSGEILARACAFAGRGRLSDADWLRYVGNDDQAAVCEPTRN